MQSVFLWSIESYHKLGEGDKEDLEIVGDFSLGARGLEDSLQRGPDKAG